MVGNVDTSILQAGTRSALMRHFNQSFPSFYSQFASSEVQTQNLRLAYTLYKTRKAVVQLSDEKRKTTLLFAFHNQPFILCDIIGVLTAFNIVVHSINLYGQLYSPHLVFMRLIISRNDLPLPKATKANLERAIHECLSNSYQVHENLALEFDLNKGLTQSRVEFYIDQVFHLPAVLVDADNEPGLFYKVAYALWQEDLTVININVVIRREQTRFIFYLLGPNASSAIPDYLGQKIATSLRTRLGAN